MIISIAYADMAPYKRYRGVQPYSTDRTATGTRAMKSISDNSVSAHIAVSRIKPLRFTEGVFEVRWRDGRRRRQILLAPADPALPTPEEVVDAVGSAYPEERRPQIMISDEAWP